MFRQNEKEAIRHIRNFLLLNGRVPSVRDLTEMMGYQSPRSAALILKALIDKGVLKRVKRNILEMELKGETIQEQTIDVPIIGSVSCGVPAEAIERVDEQKIPVSIKLAKPPYKHFFLRAKGTSMDKLGIEDKDLVLIRQIPSAQNGDIVAAVIDGEATLKEFQRVSGGVVLKPHSNDPIFKTILVSSDFLVQGVAVKDENGNIVILKDY
jgi:repressor LexA